MLRPRFAAAVLLPALLAAGCSSSGGGNNTAPSSSVAHSSASLSAGSPAAAALAAKISNGLKGLTSAHVAVNAGSLGGKSVGTFAFANGAATASDITVDSGVDKTEIVTVGSTSYAKLPKGRNTSGKPWVTVSATSKNEFVRALASPLSLSKAAASLPAVAGLAGTASSVRDQGAGHYALVIDPAKSSGTTLGTLLADIGQKTVPVDLYLDGKGRPVKIKIAVKLGTQSFTFSVAVTKFNAPVHVKAPAADQIGAG